MIRHVLSRWGFQSSRVVPREAVCRRSVVLSEGGDGRRANEWIEEKARGETPAGVVTGVSRTSGDMRAGWNGMNE